MLFQAYVRLSLLLTGVPASLDRHARAKREEDAGLATLEWVALVIIALGLAAAAGLTMKTVLTDKLAQIK